MSMKKIEEIEELDEEYYRKTMKKPKKLTPPAKDMRCPIFVEIEGACVRDYRSGEAYGGWEQQYSYNIKKISRNEKLLSKWDFTEYKVPNITLQSPTLYLVAVTYTTGDSFGRSLGNISIAYITEDSGEALKVMDDLNLGINPPKKDPKTQNGGYAIWDGYFERVESVDIVFLPVMG